VLNQPLILKQPLDNRIGHEPARGGESKGHSIVVQEFHFDVVGRARPDDAVEVEARLLKKALAIDALGPSLLDGHGLAGALAGFELFRVLSGQLRLLE